MDVEVGAVGVAPASFPGMRLPGCYSQMGESFYREAQKRGLHRKYAADDGPQLRAKMLSAPEFPPVEEVLAGFDHIATLFADDEQALCAYFETNYNGRRAGGARRLPRFGLEQRKVHNRMEAGALRTTNSVEAFRHGFSTGVSGGNRPPLWTYVETLRSQ